MKFSELVAKWEGGWHGEAISKKTGAKVEFTEESVLFEAAFKGVKLAGEWEPIPKPVLFMEAVEAQENGSIVECKVNGCCNIYEPTATKGMIDQNGRAVSANEILHGTWHIVGK